MSQRERLGIVLLPCGNGLFVLALVLGSLTLLACGDDGGQVVDPPDITRVDVASPIGTHMALGRTVQLSATARDAEDNLVGAQFSWESSNPIVATVSASGLVEGLAEGSASITAAADGVSGSLGMQVVAADLVGIDAIISDPFTNLLVSNLTDAAKSSIQTTLGVCSTNVNAGNLEAIQQCLTDALSQASAATDPDDRALLAVTALMLAAAGRLLGL